MYACSASDFGVPSAARLTGVSRRCHRCRAHTAVGRRVRHGAMRQPPRRAGRVPGRLGAKGSGPGSREPAAAAPAARRRAASLSCFSLATRCRAFC